MNKIVAACSFVCLTTSVALLTVLKPLVLSDKNDFLKGFVNHEYLSFMGVLVTITLASAANIHIELNRYDEALGRSAFEKTRTGLRHSAFALIAALCVALVTVILKPLGPDALEWQSALNGMAILTIAFSILIVADLTMAAFDLRPLMKTARTGSVQPAPPAAPQARA